MIAVVIVGEGFLQTYSNFAFISSRFFPFKIKRELEFNIVLFLLYWRTQYTLNTILYGFIWLMIEYYSNANFL